jgi:NADPH2:quinone reductase
VAISRSPEKEALARELGADGFIDATERDPATALQERGGARLVLATAPSADAIADVAGGIGRNGSVVAVGVPADPVEVEIGHLVGTRGSVAGWASGHATDWEDTLEFSALRTVIPRVETYPLAEAEAAYERMMANEARFRVVVEP